MIWPIKIDCQPFVLLILPWPEAAIPGILRFSNPIIGRTSPLNRDDELVEKSQNGKKGI